MPTICIAPPGDTRAPTGKPLIVTPTFVSRVEGFEWWTAVNYGVITRVDCDPPGLNHIPLPPPAFAGAAVQLGWIRLWRPRWRRRAPESGS